MIGSVLEDGRLFPLVMPGPEAFSSWLCIKLFKNAMNLNGDVDEVFARYQALMPDAAKKTVRGQMFTDWMFRRGTVEAAERHAGTTYLYQFDWSSPVLRGGIGAMHGIDVPFANGNLRAFEPLLGDLEAIRDLAEGRAGCVGQLRVHRYAVVAEAARVAGLRDRSTGDDGLRRNIRGASRPGPRLQRRVAWLIGPRRARFVARSPVGREEAHVRNLL